MLLNYWECTESHGVIEMLQSLLVCHSRPSAGSLFLSYNVQVALPYIYQCFTTQHPQPILWWSCRYSCILLCFQSSISPFRRSSFTRLWYKRSLAQFYGNVTTVVRDGVTFSSPPLTDKDEIAVEWRLFKRALIQESRLVREEKKTAKVPSLHDVKVRMEASGACLTSILLFL